MQKCLHDVFNLGLRLQELNPQSIVFVINLLSRAVVSQLAMNVLEHIECESSAESDLNVVYIRMILTMLVKMMTTMIMNCRTNRILWQIPRRALLVEAPVLKVPATHPHQHPDLVRFRCSVC